MLKLKELKEKLNSVIFMGVGAGLAIIAVLIMFAPALVIGAKPYAGTDLFWAMDGNPFLQSGCWPIFVGYMMILISALIMGIIAMPFVRINVKVEKTLLFTCIAFCVIGSILIMCTRPLVIGMNGILVRPITYRAGPFVAGVFGLLAGGCGVIALLYDWR